MERLDGFHPGAIPVPEGWTIPEGWGFVNLGNCRSCRQLIAWCSTPAGRRAPVNRDGVSHFATCPDAQKWRYNR